MRRVGGAQHQFLAVEQVDQAGIAFGEFHDQGDDALQNVLQAHFPDHEAADLLEQAQLLLGALQAHLEVFGFRHDFIIAFGGTGPFAEVDSRCG